MDALTVEVAGRTFRYRGAVHGRFPDTPRWHAGLREGQVLWGSREGDACFLILDHRRAPGAGSCRIELWEATEPLDATATGLLPLADERSGGGEGSGGDSLSRLVTRIAGATAAV